MPMLKAALLVAKWHQEFAKEKGLEEAVRLKRTASKSVKKPSAYSSTKTNMTASMTSSMSTISSSANKLAFVDESSVGSHLTAEVSLSGNSETNANEAKKCQSTLKKTGAVTGPVPHKTTAASVPVPRNISTGESTQEVRSMSLKVAKLQKEAQITLQMLKATITCQEEEESRRGNEAEEALQEAKNKLAAGNKRAAIRYMKKFKRCHLEQDKITAAIEMMEEQLCSIESVLNSVKCVEAMQASMSALSSLRGTDGKTKGPSLADKVEDLMDDLKDSDDIAVAIDMILSRDVTAAPIDDDDLLKELERLSGLHDTATAARTSGSLPPDLPEAP